MSLVTVLNAHLAYGDQPLLDGAQITVQTGERIGLIGRNGTGKSSLLKVIAGLAALDEGELQRRDGLRISFVAQEPQLARAATLRASLLVNQSHADEREHWRMESRLEEYLHRFNLDGERSPDNSSGGERKRAAL